MKKYVFEVRVEEGANEFWEELERRGVTGADEICEEIKNTLGSLGMPHSVVCVKYEDSSPKHNVDY